MGNSIQDYLKKINSSLSFSDTVSLCLTALFLILFSAYLLWSSDKAEGTVIYRTEADNNQGEGLSSRPFGSRSGTTYTYSWCQGGVEIKPENKIYYASPEEAEQSGRRISKLCQK